MEVYTREKEHRIIGKFLSNNLRKGQSGLMYLCGHPGTGKTSSLNQVLQSLRKASHNGKVDEFQLYMYNAMTFTDVRNFALSLLQDVTEKKTGLEVDRLNRQSVDDEELSLLVAKALSGKSRVPKSTQKPTEAEMEATRIRQKRHSVIVIDEVDQFNSSEKAFTTLV